MTRLLRLARTPALLRPSNLLATTTASATRRWLRVSAVVRNDDKPSPPPAPPQPPKQHEQQQQQRRKEEEHRCEHASVDLPVNVPGPSSYSAGVNTGGGGGLGSPMQFPPAAPWDAALTTLIGLGIVFVGGIGYVFWYKRHVLNKIETAFEGGYDPALELAKFGDLTGSKEIEHLRRKEQDLIDKIIAGEKTGHYYVLLGSKGSGKGSMILDAMHAVDAEGCAILECHPDIEVLRQRIGKAINFEYYEDSQTGLFQRRDPREAGPALDIERALNKLEKVALRYAKRKGRPVVLIFNNAHLVGNTDDGRNMLLQLQQRAETWAESGICTCIFSTDDAWPYFSMRRTANRAHFISVGDLSAHEAFVALQRLRRTKTKSHEVLHHEVAEYHDVIQYTGGRLSMLNKVARAHNMLEMARDLLEVEKGWLRSQVGLIDDCDDDVMDEQKWSSCTWLLMKEFVRLRIEQEEDFARKVESGEVDEIEAALQHLPLPTVPYHQARQLMTRTDFLEELDRLNIIAVDTHYNVRPDSMLILRSAREVVEEEGFDDLLESVRDRIDAIESLHRTRELTLKHKDSSGWTFVWPFI